MPSGASASRPVGIRDRVSLPPIRGHAGEAATFAALSPTDTGIGIPPHRLTRVFAPVYATTGVGEGAELGPSQDFGSAKPSGGDVDVEIARPATQIHDDLGDQSRWACDADKALTWIAARDAAFGVVLSNLVMPGTDGIDLARGMRRLNPDLPIVLTSGYSHVLAAEGPHGFDPLHEPHSAEQLSRALRRAAAG